MSDGLGKKLSETSLDDILDTKQQILNNSNIVNIESSGKIVKNLHTNRILIMFGLYYGCTINEIPQNYIDWIINNKSFSIEFRSKLNKLYTFNNKSNGKSKS